MTFTKVLFQDLQNDIVPAGQDVVMVGANKYYGTNATGQAGFFPLVAISVQQYAGVASFPATGLPNVLYIDSVTNEVYEWNGAGYDNLSNNEVQAYADFATFPATWATGVVYVDLLNDDTYIWDTTTNAYIIQWGAVVPVPTTELFTLAAGATTITLALTPSTLHHVVVIRNGLELTEWAARDYTKSANVITLLNPAFASDLFTVKYYA